MDKVEWKARRRFRVLVVDDQPDIVALLRAMLTAEGFDIVVAQDALSAIRAAYQSHPDAILLDVMMPDVDGFEACRRLREMTDVPIIFVTAKGAIEDVLHGLSLGADDYVFKPFQRSELVNRLAACLRRAGERAEGGDYRFPAESVALDCDRQELTIGNQTVHLAPKEFEVLRLLIRHTGKVLNTDVILARVWDPDLIGKSHLVEQCIYRLRQKIEPDPSSPRYLYTVRGGGGYYFDASDLLGGSDAATEEPSRFDTGETGQDDESTALQEEIKHLRLKLQELGRSTKLPGEREPSGKAGIVSFGKLGQLVSGIIHDLRGGIGIIRNTLGFVLDDANVCEALVNDLRRIAYRTEFCEVVIRNLMSLGGGELLSPTEVNIEEVVRAAFSMLERKLVDVVLIVDADPDTPTIMADEGQMKQAFMNLIKNAGEAMLNGGTLTVRTRRDDGMLRVEVSDTGWGIPPKNLDRIFDLYFSTKDKRFGMGLHILWDIIECHGGAIEVESAVGHGTIFILHLPITAEPVPASSDGQMVLPEKEIRRLYLQRLELRRRVEALERGETPDKARSISLSELRHFVLEIARDLQEEFSVIRNSTGFLIDDVDKNSSLAIDLQKIARSVLFCEVVAKNLMILGGEDVFSPTEVNVEKVVREVFFMLERRLEDVTLVMDADPGTPTIIADEGQMKQVFMNLVKNAGEAMPNGGTLTARTRCEGEKLRIELRDTGCGISPENRKRLFQELFTTKERGYGLGLLIVHTIVQRHGGTIEVESKVEEGTTFILRLPTRGGGRVSVENPNR